MLQNILQPGQMLVFLAIAVASLMYLAFAALFGGDHGDTDHGHDGSHGDHLGDTVSFLSPKIIAAFALGFGAAGAIASAYGLAPHLAILIGIGVGFLIGLVALLMLRGIYGQQASSEIQTDLAIGKQGEVTIGIPQNGNGQVEVVVKGQSCTYLAKGVKGQSISRGRTVKVVSNSGGTLTVEQFETN